MKPAPTYTIEGSPGERFILCLLCKSASWNPNDIDQLYCPVCKMFHIAGGYMEDDEKITMPTAMADEKVVFALTRYLLDAFSKFLVKTEAGKNLSYVDGMMSLHNFHVHLLVDMAQKANEPILLISALSTFEVRMKAEIAKMKGETVDHDN